MLSRPGKPKRIISATLLNPGFGSGGISINSFSIGTATSDGVIGGDKAVDADTLPKIGRPGWTLSLFVTSPLSFS